MRDRRTEYYDLDKDPDELVNLSKEYPQRMKEYADDTRGRRLVRDVPSRNTRDSTCFRFAGFKIFRVPAARTIFRSQPTFCLNSLASESYNFASALRWHAPGRFLSQ